MRLAISNLAWDIADDEEMAALLQSYGIDAIDIAPGKYFPTPALASAADMERVRDWWAGRGIEITGLQALLFGTSGLNLFGEPPVQHAMLEHLDSVCRIGAGTGARRVVFGSPRNRDRSALDDAETTARATCFLQRLAEVASRHQVLLCLEPNPPCYGANFMTTSAETAAWVRRIDNPALRMQLDTGAMAINGEDVRAVVQEYAGLIGHIHASEPDLVPLGDGATDHLAASAVLQELLPHHVVTIEMLATRGEPARISVQRALQHAIRCYRPEKPQ